MARSPAGPAGNRNQRVWQGVMAIPCGRVATYGQLAGLTGLAGPTGPRQVGYALAALKAGSTIPWHRVLNAAGRISARDTPGGQTQREILEGEGVEFDLTGRVDLGIYRWNP